MTPRIGPLSENEKALAFALLFPLLWPFIPVLLVCMAADKIRGGYWDWRCRRSERKQDAMAGELRKNGWTVEPPSWHE